MSEPTDPSDPVLAALLSAPVVPFTEDERAAIEAAKRDPRPGTPSAEFMAKLDALRRAVAALRARATLGPLARLADRLEDNGQDALGALRVALDNDAADEAVDALCALRLANSRASALDPSARKLPAWWREEYVNDAFLPWLAGEMGFSGLPADAALPLAIESYWTARTDLLTCAAWAATLRTAESVRLANVRELGHSVHGPGPDSRRHVGTDPSLDALSIDDSDDLAAGW